MRLPCEYETYFVDTTRMSPFCKFKSDFSSAAVMAQNRSKVSSSLATLIGITVSIIVLLVIGIYAISYIKRAGFYAPA